MIFLTFNYTDTLESVYCIDPDNIKHIYGYVKNKNEELVIGHCNQKAISYALEKKKEAEVNFVDFAVSTFDRVSKYFNTTLKRTSNIIYENTEFFNSLSNVDEVIIIGHSLNKVDMPYIEKVLPDVLKPHGYQKQDFQTSKFQNHFLLHTQVNHTQKM